MKRVVVGFVAAVGASLGLAVPALASDQGNLPPDLSFFSGGGGAYASWVYTQDQDGDGQTIQIHDTTAPTGYAGVEVHHVYGMPTATAPNSEYWVKSDQAGPSLGSPRLVIRFSDGGRAELRPLAWTPTWQDVTDPNWDSNGGTTCPFVYETTWQTVQGCHPGTFITDAYFTSDPGTNVTHEIDNIDVLGFHFTEGADNSHANG